MKIEQEIETHYKTINLLCNLKKVKSLRVWSFHRYLHRGKGRRRARIIIEGAYKPGGGRK